MVGLRGDLPDGNDTIAHRMCTPRLELDQSGSRQSYLSGAEGPAHRALHVPQARRMLARRPTAAPRMTDMPDRKQPPLMTPRTVLLAVAAVFALFYGGYQVGKDLAMRENAQQTAGR